MLVMRTRSDGLEIMSIKQHGKDLTIRSGLLQNILSIVALNDGLLIICLYYETNNCLSYITLQWP